MTGRRITRARLGVLAVCATLSVLPLTLPGQDGGAAPGVARLDAQREQVRVLEAELSRIDADTAVAADAAADARGRLAELKTQIRRNGTAARRARVAHATASDRLSERLVAMNTRREPDMVTVLLTSGSLNEAVQVRDIWARIGRHDAIPLQRELADRLRALVRPGDTLARSDDDEFALLVAYVPRFSGIVGAGPVLIEPCTILGVAEGGSGFLAAPSYT